MDCRDCSLYEPERDGCRSGKLNPHTKENAVEVVQLLGLRALCVFNDFREPLIQHMLDDEVREGLLGPPDQRPTRRRHK